MTRARAMDAGFEVFRVGVRDELRGDILPFVLVRHPAAGDRRYVRLRPANATIFNGGQRMVRGGFASKLPVKSPREVKKRWFIGRYCPGRKYFLRTMHDAQSRQSGGKDNDGLFLRLFVRHEQALRAYARVIVPTWDAVDEVIQEASVVMWRKLDQLDSHENFLPWAKVIVRFEALRARRNFARDRLVFSEELLSMLADEVAETQEEELEREKAGLMRCLKKLTPAYQELLLAPYTGSGRVKELAEQSGRSINSLYKLLGRLRAKLQGCIEHELSVAARQTGRGELRTMTTQ